MNKTKKILLVEDDASIRKIISLKLQDEGYEVFCANDGEQALETLTNGNTLPDLVWLDIYLPKMNGLDLLDRIRKDAKLADLPVLVVSVSGSNEKTQRAKELGVIEYCVKSNFKIDELIEKAELFLGEKKKGE